MAIYLRRANQDDLQRIMEIIEQARAQLKEKGNPQWQDGHPFPKTMKSDIKAGYNWVLIDNQKIVGTATLQLTPEQTYEEIKDGSWLKPNEPYAIIHRLAVLPSHNGQGFGKYIFSNLLTVGYLQGVRNFRYDTHYKNIPVQKIGQEIGFIKRGTIYIDDKIDNKHMGFELNLK
ncbi:GNAT family N-acetyltransferase [Limosilactobacillus reuteri]|uniref:GNAT family N-acetyltransferase n=1 Tax=Limosilactobacillus reuteri TaxID=1598 RepID=UPI001E37891C|nr:GNAT family N-acetyltransferase [Limosilactobacillus reuteri]MCC4397157.1 GNAT family N-acetyltransferase [Limosilactobacillus reuteri]MCC4409214.1 GNAT family N-acetyltransferase [Limosilactobacillus reuteri]MCC4422254.1 GNAT family N-acetyltransferase [Limosilactobacillus reuteri]